MRTFFCIYVFVLFSIHSIAQTNEPVTDSIKYYQKEIAAISKRFRDSTLNHPSYRALQRNVARLRAKTDNYDAFTLYSQFASANFKTLNADNAQSGFGSLSGTMCGIGFGFSFKKNRRIINLEVAGFGLNKKVKKDDEVIKTSFSTLLQLEWGYDFIKSRTVNIYPYAGLGVRQTLLSYEADPQVNTPFTNITDIIQNDPSASGDITQVGYQAGIGMEFVLTNSEYGGGTLVFIKAGTNGSFSHKPFKIEGQKYDPKLNYGEWVISAGFKFFGR